ncbi:DUF3817 domain-containing protein [Stackebrandtia nassauensis]|uniref:DUF3817 domain-containing protein n=1 Tax=Stackebrandtia nassauensis (strain DSM 44728 / CIP 108903 / NRRL B-16338 / NBRC 102104 / LLR-40K-21) TaxID=446470 RepID=D3PZY8_STANL|nr:DUF3817 domain-containing protein [Stackebrandtia nassauensis]ADD43675.1 conserved hypothetical protein [Stackebrandtia nassauensis DSM 44728]
MDAKPEIGAALRRYQVTAWIVSVFLVALFFVAMPVRYIGGEPVLSAIISPIHGFGYMVYLAFAFDLARRMGWSLWPRTVLLLLAGTVPVVSFVTERWTTRQVLAEQEEPQVSETSA